MCIYNRLFKARVGWNLIILPQYAITETVEQRTYPFALPGRIVGWHLRTD